MKANLITRLLVGTGISLALAAALAFPVSSTADQPLKGAQILTGAHPAQYAALPPLDLTAGSAACPSCTNSVKSVVNNAGRGAFAKTAVIVTHQCPLCKTALVTTGAGKAKTTTAVHTCGSGTTPSCCGGMAGM